MIVRMIAGCLVALTLVVGVGGCGSMGMGSGLLDQLGGNSTAPLSSGQVTEAAKKVDAPTSSGLTDSLMKAL